MILVRLNNNHWLTRDLTGDDLQRSPALEMRVDGERLLEESLPLGAAWARLFDRGQLRTRLSFQVESRHATPAAAALHLLEALPKAFTGSAEVFLGSAEDGWLVLRFSQAGARATEKGRLDGATARITYELTGTEPDAITLSEGASPELLPATVNAGHYGSVFGPPEAGAIDGGFYGEDLTANTPLALDWGSY